MYNSNLHDFICEMSNDPIANVGPGTGPKLLKTGQDAVDAISIVLPTATAINVNGGVMGTVTLKPGTLWGNREKLLVYAGPTTVYYSKGDGLYEAYTPDFVRDEWLTAFSQGASKAEWLIPIAQAEFALIQAFLAPTWMVATIAIAKGVAFYSENKQLINSLVIRYRTFDSLLQEGKKRFPKLWAKVFGAGTAWDIFVFTVQNIRPIDVAYFLGRLLGFAGLNKVKGGFLTAPAEKTVEITWGVVIKLTIFFAALVTFLHAPEIVAAALHKKVEELGKVLARNGIKVSPEEVRQIVAEIAADKEAGQLFDDIRAAADDLIPTLKQLGISWERINGTL